ncbi:ubiquinol-cytochrome c reductase cytochrome b subunit [Gulosibacter macacae]|uniref:Cytochrome bc1 complex cytochrome b subunit n=1 Tax=Gulosibacter macacae TaxID=2488791 RepID=A0A3P3VXU9_9MICO|nr:cytochrome bc complex cytochrome b subunit [Gulosibacter macacae]RRJ86289.1 ubiquinol-cytochrome c reductase cytochrome b subunit [Gulosibacter macacae]
MTTTYKAPVAEGSAIAKASSWIDDRTSISGAVKEFGRKIFPDHWSFMLGEVALYSFIAILLSGTFLTFFFDPSMAHTTYHGSYIPMKGMEMSAAMASTLDISFDVRGGLLMRQVHHWAALLFVASTMLHMARIFFTGAFRKPRELNWIIGLVLWIIAMLEGFSGYSLPDDLLSGNGLRIVDGMIKGVPVLGTWISFWLFGGEFPGDMIVGRLYSLHIMILPALLIVFLAMHMLLMVINKHTQWPGPGHTNQNVVGNPVLPVFATKAVGFLFIVLGIIFGIASFFQINPIWNYGPYDPSPVSAGTQPDWYIGFGDGALRLIPPGWEMPLGDYTVTWAILVPFLMMGIFVIGLFVYPFLEAWITGDKREHHILDRPRNAPTRTALGVAWMSFYATMWAAASSDLIATHFHMAMEHVIHALQFWLIFGTIITFWVTKRACLALQRADRAVALHGTESGRIIRLPHGEFQEVEIPVEEDERWKLVSYNSYQPIVAQPDPATGKVKGSEKFRATLSRWFFADRLEPLTPAEIEAAHHEHHGELKH